MNGYIELVKVARITYKSEMSKYVYVPPLTISPIKIKISFLVKYHVLIFTFMLITFQQKVLTLYFQRKVTDCMLINENWFHYVLGEGLNKNKNNQLIQARSEIELAWHWRINPNQVGLSIFPSFFIKTPLCFSDQKCCSLFYIF